MRWLLIVIVLLTATACPRQESPRAGPGSAAQTVPPPSSAAPARLAIVCAATESDPWTTELLAVAGAELGFSPWSEPAADEQLDRWGPYDGQLHERPLEISLCLVGFTGVVDVLGQEALGAQVREWIEALAPDVLWLDGDPAQFQIGRYLPPEVPIVFTGVVLDRTLYYTGEQRTTGVYRRHSVPRVLEEVWRDAPEAQTYALLLDNAPASAGRAQRFIALSALLEEGQEFLLMPAAEGWQQLAGIVRQAAAEADALIFCGVGEEACSAEFQEESCPAGLLGGIEVPVVTLGPSRVDHSGAVSLQIKPAAHAQAALRMIAKVLAGTDPRAIPVVTPDDMSVFVSERE